jgi:hypothetical protein
MNGGRNLASSCPTGDSVTVRPRQGRRVARTCLASVRRTCFANAGEGLSLLAGMATRGRRQFSARCTPRRGTGRPARTPGLPSRLLLRPGLGVAPGQFSHQLRERDTSAPYRFEAIGHLVADRFGLGRCGVQGSPEVLRNMYDALQRQPTQPQVIVRATSAPPLSVNATGRASLGFLNSLLGVNARHRCAAPGCGPGNL